ncbi:hypothetical protein TFKS16_2396 [Tannerella forsythia KS16]|uniref:Uncharacterized protein n=1 Tax=Tannerella forsythia (strain ATCC 43037 / JCM 10827 / CCUG 21028 A / KCTC 5666 / FDC 338) TaxID=203275 RepID=G8ULV4_TANFA|nr:hypothetical protein BFO_2664 [Tannerella forsythia 92A2]BAR49777.1 hypothetical protein TF3313_2332 [Tannerella forsythia 3313]BAR52587.1 hypothetical protein TFKS16_2396 [Tannerella forsythia KS16]
MQIFCLFFCVLCVVLCELSDKITARIEKVTQYARTFVQAKHLDH